MVRDISRPHRVPLAVLLLAPTLVAVAAASSEACLGGEKDFNAVALAPAPGARVNRDAPAGGLYVTASTAPDGPSTWRETNLGLGGDRSGETRGLQLTPKVCYVSEANGGYWWYTLFPADTPVEEPEQAVP